MPGLPNLDRVVAPVGDFLKDIGDWLSQFGGGSYNLDIEDNQGEPDTENCNLYPVVPCNDQAGAVILAINEYLVLKPLERLFFNDLTSNENSVSGFKKPNLTVLMTINYQSGEISLDRPDISATLEDPYTYYSETEYQNLLKLLNEEPVVFDENDQIWYSNGLFSPPVVDGISVEDSNTPNYTYVTRYIDQDGQTIEMDNNDSKLPENLFTKVIKGAFQNSSSFGITDVSYVTYRLVDPNVSIPYDEYYDYIIGLKSGETRSTVLPQYTSYSFTEKRLKGVGYQGDIMSLMSQAIEVFEAPKKGLGLRLVDGVVNYFTKFVDMFTSKNETMVATDFPTINYDLNTNDIERIFIYPNAVTFCEEITESSAGFVYVAVLKDRSDPKYNTVITDGRCGYGGVDDWVEETATQLEVKYEIKNVTFDNIINKTFIRTEEVALIPGIDVVETGPVEVDNDIGIDEDVISDEANSEEQQVVISNQLPNLTNTISFEVKAVGSSGSVLSDWTSAESIDIGSGVQLYFRWNGSDYAQCLPFLNDNGNYALTVSNRAMITGDTESEGYNVPERTATYRIECGGQRNNEFGVDYREVNVTVQ